MIDRMLILVKLLRDSGVPVSTPEVMDSLDALALVPGYDDPTVKTILRAALIKDKDFNHLFEEAFDRAFALESEAVNALEGNQALVGAGNNGMGNALEGSGGKGRSGGGKRSAAGQETISDEGEDLSHTETKSSAGGYLPGERTLMDIPFVAAGQKQRDEMLLLIKELSKKMADKKGVRQRRRGNQLNFRKLWRDSMGCGGVPFELSWQQRRPNKPRVFIICDLSNSMIAYLPFVLEFVFTFASLHSTVRVFGFVDALEEITDWIDPFDIKKSVDNICSGPKMIWRGNTDYGNAFRGFCRYHRDELTNRTSTLIVGDARNNYNYSQAHFLTDIRHRGAGIYWLNPEDRSYWGMGDSYMHVYEPYCDGVFECENISQLKGFMNYFATSLYSNI